MKIVIAKDQPMEFQPRIKPLWTCWVKRHDFVVKCWPQSFVLNERDTNPVLTSSLGGMIGRIRVFLGPSIYYNKQNEYLCGLWVKDLGTFLKKLFIHFEKDKAELLLTVKHLGQEIGDEDFRLELWWEPSRPRTAVKCRRMSMRRPAQGQHGLSQMFTNINPGSFTVTMVLNL